MGYAIDKLLGAALRAGALPEFNPDEDSWPIGLPGQVAYSHRHSDENGNCPHRPCPLGGICLALTELLQHQAEGRHETSLATLQQTDMVRKALRRSLEDTGYIELLTAFRQPGMELDRVEKDRGATTPLHNHMLFCEQPRRVADRLSEALAELDAFDKSLRDAFWSADLQQAADQNRGELVFTAVMQHLKWTGGLSYSEIGDLTIGGKLDAELRRDRVRARLRSSSDVRSIFPWGEKRREGPQRSRDSQ